jgi:hypothetical protein
LYSPESRLTVFDDDSDDAYTREVLGRVDAEIIASDADRSSPSVEHHHGRLFDNMNRALDMAQSRGIELLHLVQEDFQLVRREPEIFGIAAQLMAHVDASQVTLHFWKRLGTHKFRVLPDREGYISGPGMGDVGIFPVERLTQRGFRFGQSEAASSELALQLGLRAYSVADPVLARVPWPMHARFRALRGGMRGTHAPLLVKPLGDREINALKKRELIRLPFGEDYCEPWGWRCWKPYPTGPSYRSWLKQILANARNNRSLNGLVPRRAGSPFDAAEVGND